MEKSVQSDGQTELAAGGFATTSLFTLCTCSSSDDVLFLFVLQHSRTAAHKSKQFQSGVFVWQQLRCGDSFPVVVRLRGLARSRIIRE